MLYMLIDTTTLEEIRVTAVASLRRVELLGRLEVLTKGRTVIAPPVEGRGFSKLDKMQLQYLYWNHLQQTPPEEYSELIQRMLDVVSKIPVSDADVEALEREVARLSPQEVPSGDPGVPKEPKASAPASRPSGKTTTGYVWDIADKVYGEMHPSGDPKSANWKAVRDAIIAACEKEGINSATAATQYSKWKKDKEGSKQ